MADRSGQQLGMYRLIRPAGQDKLGERYLALDLRDQSQTIIQAPPVGTNLFTLYNRPGEVETVEWSPISPFLASGTKNGVLEVWAPVSIELQSGKSLAAGTSIFRVNGHSLGVFSYAPNGTRIATAEGKKVRIWDLSSTRHVAEFSGHSGALASGVLSLAWSPDGSRVASGGTDQTVRIWDVASGTNTLIYQGHSGNWLNHVTCIAWSPVGSRIVSVGNQSIQVWNPETGATLVTYTGHGGQPRNGAARHCAWSPDGSRIASGGFDQLVHVWDSASGQQIYTCSGHTSAVTSVAWSPDGTRIASASIDKTVRLWDVDDGRELFAYGGHKGFFIGGYPQSVAWSGDGLWVASGGTDRVVHIWQGA